MLANIWCLHIFPVDSPHLPPFPIREMELGIYSGMVERVGISSIGASSQQTLCQNTIFMTFIIGTTNSESQKSIALPSRLRGKKLDLSTTVSWQIMCLLLLPTDCLWSEPDIKFIVSPDSPEIWRGETKYRIYEFLLSKRLKVWFCILDILNPLEGGIISPYPFLDFTFKLCYCINRSVGVRDVFL